MEKYFCKNCKSFIDADKIEWYASSIDEDGHCFEGFDGEIAKCPYCGDTYIVDAVKCKGCGEWHTEDELTEGYCVKCEKKIQDKVTEFFKQFNEDEKNYIFESGILEEV